MTRILEQILIKIKPARKWRVTFFLTGIVLVGFLVWFILRINNLVGQEKDQQQAGSRVEVSESRLRAPVTDGLTMYLNPSEVRATATFGGARYFATSGGLIQLDSGGAVKHRYTTLDGLPDNDLTALAVFNNRLFIGTASHGLIAFDGTVFTGYSFVKPKAADVKTLAATDSRLLIGTLDGGLFEYDGERFSRRLNSAAGADFTRVTAVLPVASRVYIGTQDLGLFIWKEAHMERLAVSDGLPSPHVTGLVALGGSGSTIGDIAVATDFGAVTLTEANQIVPISNRPNITSLALSGGRLWAGLFSGGLAELHLEPESARIRAVAPDVRESAISAGLPPSAPALVTASEGKLWALTGDGAFCRDEAAPGPAFVAVAASAVGGSILSSAHITSLAFDDRGRLWIGYFDRGIDTVELETGERLSHLEDDRVREINFIKYNRLQAQVLAATSSGLVIFDDRSRQTALTREHDGLISDSIAHVLFIDAAALSSGAAVGPASAADRSGQALVLATGAGLTEIVNGKVRSINAFHGLPSNHLYCSAAASGRLFAGSLAGLVEIDGLRVVRTYKTSNSPRSHDWVTALCEGGGTLYVGTNGGGVDALLPTGEWVNFSDQIGRFEVNQNAMLFDGERLYVGTSQQGLLSYNTRGRRWTRFTSGLPSQNITAIASDDRFIYVGSLSGLMRIEKRVLAPM